MILILENAINYDTLEEAKLMIQKGRLLTKKTGVRTLSKFQLFNEGNIVNPEHKEYCLKRMLSKEDARELVEYGKSIRQEVFFTVDFPEAVDWCEEIGVNYYKIRFYDNANEHLIRKVVETGKPFFISVYPYGSGGLIWKNQILLNCIPKYPAKRKDYTVWGEMGLIGHGHGVSDHVSDLSLYTWFTTSNLYEMLKHYDYYWERHVCLNGRKEMCLEREWCSMFEELEEVLSK